MSLLAPWFLVGLGLLAGPIIAHLIRRATRQRIPFSAVQFLEDTRPRLERRSRIQHPWLLVLRCLILALLALAFARPYWASDDAPAPAAAPHRQVVVILDESASMQRTGLGAAARERVEAIVEQLQPNDHLVLLGAGEHVRELVTLEQWRSTQPRQRRQLVETVLAQRAPSFGPTPLDAAVEAALAHWELMAETDAGAAQRQLVIVSDFTAGARVAGLASIAWPGDAGVRLETVTPTSSGNASVHWLGWTTGLDGSAAVRLRLQRSFDSAGPLYWQMYDAETAAVLTEREPVELLPGGSQALTVAWPEDAGRSVRFELTGDGEAFDNRLWIVRPESRELVVTHLGRAAPDDPRSSAFFLGRALAGLQEPRPRLTEVLADAGTPSLIIIDEPVDPGLVAAVRNRLDRGAFAVVLLNQREAAALLETASQLAGETGWSSMVPERSDALLGQLDFRHPLFAPFADPLYSDFTRIRFWEPQSVELPPDTATSVVARFDDGSPAVLEAIIGDGRLIVWGGDWTPAASQWVLSSKFVPWLQALAERAAGGAMQPGMLDIGRPGRDPALRAVSTSLRREGLPADATAPGVFELGSPERRQLVAFNVPASESLLEPLPLDLWEQLGVPLQSGETAPATLLQQDRQRFRQSALQQEQQQQAWRTLLWLALALLAAESAFSRILARRRSDAANPADAAPVPPPAQASA